MSLAVPPSELTAKGSWILLARARQKRYQGREKSQIIDISSGGDTIWS
jgi:hypothetical protein